MKTPNEERQERFSVQVSSVYSSCLLVLICLGCASPTSNQASISIFAAASLTEAFTELKTQFEKKHPNHEVVLNFGGSQVLRLQIEHGASADVFASADKTHIQALKSSGTVLDTHRFAWNRLGIIVARGHPEKLEHLSDLTRARRIVLGAQHSPIGKYTTQLLNRIDQSLGANLSKAIRHNVVSREKNVRLVRAKVVLGVADVAIVYASDARAIDTVDTIPIPDDLNPRIEYVAARLTPTPGSHLWLEFLTSTQGQETLKRAGFKGVR